MPEWLDGSAGRVFCTPSIPFPVPELTLTSFDNLDHRKSVIALWERVFGYEAAHNRPELAIDKKREVNDGLFFVALAGGEVVGTIMAGYDGHRGWIYSLAVHPGYRRQGIGTRLAAHAEQALAARGCMKINLQIMPGNAAVTAFYTTLGYAEEPRISMGKQLPENVG